MSIKINAVDLQWKGRYGGGGGDAGSGGTGLSESDVRSMINSALSGVNTVTMEQVQEAIEAAGTGGSVDLPWSEIQVGFVTREQILQYNPNGIANSTTFRVPFPKTFTKVPLLIARTETKGARIDAQLSGTTTEYFQMQSNYVADVQGVHFIAFIPKG